ncbi:hypothetical protein QP786_09465, partial [Gleimia europaea]|nr:hypothetical protein [Gleimia europaea]
GVGGPGEAVRLQPATLPVFLVGFFVWFINPRLLGDTFRYRVESCFLEAVYDFVDVVIAKNIDFAHVVRETRESDI